MKRRELTLGEEVTNAILHGIGIGLAIAALVVLVVFASMYGDVWYVVGFSIYGATLIILYVASTLYHSFPKGKCKNALRVVDHSSIFLLIAGTYTPIALILLRGSLGWTIFGIVWGIAVVGITLKFLWLKKFEALSVVLYIAMGWLIVIAFKPLLAVMNQTAMSFLIAGGVTYSVGIVFYAWKSLKYGHAIWHLFVLGGSICHFMTMLFIIPR